MNLHEFSEFLALVVRVVVIIEIVFFSEIRLLLFLQKYIGIKLGEIKEIVKFIGKKFYYSEIS